MGDVAKPVLLIYYSGYSFWDLKLSRKSLASGLGAEIDRYLIALCRRHAKMLSNTTFYLSTYSS
jgi:hypothetical protein